MLIKDLPHSRAISPGQLIEASFYQIRKHACWITYFYVYKGCLCTKYLMNLQKYIFLKLTMKYIANNSINWHSSSHLPNSIPFRPHRSLESGSLDLKSRVWPWFKCWYSQHLCYFIWLKISLYISINILFIMFYCF